MEMRKTLEREFHNRLRSIDDDDHVADTRWSPALEPTIASNPMWANMKYYAIERRSRETVLDWFRDNCPGKAVLDMCCGNGEDSVFIAKSRAAKVVGIDISDQSVANCRSLAERSGVGQVASFETRDAEDTGFADNSFDIVSEYGALHHLDLDRAMAEIVRILKPDGKAICVEALGHNVAIHLYRRMTPELRTAWEVDHILRRQQFEHMKRHFGRIEMRFFHLFTLAAVPFRNTVLFGPLLAMLEKLDNIVLKLPGLRWQAWQTVFVLSEPKKSGTG